MTISADDARDISVAVQPSSREVSLTKEGSVGAGCVDRQSSALRLQSTPRWLSKGNIAHLFQKKAPRLSSSTREGVEHSATDDYKVRHASRGRQVALKVAQRAASLTRLLASRNGFSAKNLPAIDSRHSEEPSSSFSSRSVIIPPRRAYSYGTYPTTSSIGQTLLMDSSRPDLFGVGTSNAMPLQTAASMSADSLTTTAGASRRHANKGFSRLVQAYPDIAAEAHILCDFACSLDHAGIRWYGRMYVSSTHLYFSGTGISLSSTTGACKASNDLVQQQQQQQPAVPLWTAVQCQSSLSLASTPSLSQEYASYELRSQRPLYGPYSQSSWPQTTRLTFSMDEIPQQIQQSASQSSKRSNLGDRSSMAKPLRRTTIKLALPDITRVTKELTLGIWPNAMTVSTTHRQYIFTNFLRRDKAYQCLYDVWNSTLPVSSQMQPLRRAKQRSRIPEQYTTQQQLAVPLARMSTEGAPLQPSLPLSTTANDSPHQQTPLQVDVLECATTNTVAACHGSNESLVVSPSSAETEDIDTADRTLIKRQSRPTTSPQQHALHSSNAHKIHHNNNNNNNFFAWQRLDPVMLVGQLIGVVSRSTLFILLSLVVFCLLSSITFL